MSIRKSKMGIVRRGRRPGRLHGRGGGAGGENRGAGGRKRRKGTEQ